MPTLLGVILLGGAGAAARYAVERYFSRGDSVFPWATILVNVGGSFLVGVLFVVATERLDLAPWIRTSLLAGLVGGLTTFSAFSLQTFRLIEQGSISLAAANVAVSVGAGLAAVALGIGVARVI